MNPSSSSRHAAPSPGAWRSNSAAFASVAAEQERRLAVGERGRRRQLGVQVLEAARGELVAEQGVRRAADPERMPAREHVVVEAGLGDLGGPDAAAEPVVALEHDRRASRRARAARRRRAS